MDSQGKQQEQLEEGFDAYLGKPFKAGELQALVREWMPA